MNVVLLHGFGEDASVWGEFVKKLPGENTFFMPDFSLLGHLKNISAYAAWLKEEVDKKGWNEMVIIGHSMGGYIALEFAKANKKMIRGLGLFHSTSLPDTADKKKNRDKTAAAIEAGGSEAFISAFYPKMFTKLFQKENSSFIESQVKAFSKFPKEALIAATLAMKTRKDNRSLLKSLNVPVLQIIGGQDAFIPKLQAMEESLLLKIPYTLVIENVAHAGMFEAPDACASVLSEFLKNCRKG